MLLLKAFWFIANFPLFRLSCTIWYVCWLVILELNLWACYSSNDILFLLVLFLPGLDMFYEVLSYSIGIHIWCNQNSISCLTALQCLKPKYFLFFCMMLELVIFFLISGNISFRIRNSNLQEIPLGVFTYVFEEQRGEWTCCPLAPRAPPSLQLWRMGWGW